MNPAKYLLGLLLCFSLQTAFGQALVNNNGALVTITPGALVVVKTGSVNNGVNGAGFLDNAGTLIVEGNFENNDTATGGGTTGFYQVQEDWINNADFIADSSTVELYGANQLITGTSITEFHILDLTGTGIKTQTIDSRVNQTLSLNDRELATDGNKMSVINPDPAAITLSSGFVSSTGNGRLSRDMNVADTYLFPTGSSTGTPRYRPVDIITKNTLNQTFEVRMANVDATTEGFDRNVKDPALCDVNPLFYHLIERPVGTNNAVDVTFTYDQPNDGNWETVARWQNLPQWEGLQNTVAAANTLSIIGFDAFKTVAPDPYAFAILNPELDTASTVVTDAICFGDGTGGVDIEVVGGPFDYSWSNTDQTQDISGVPAGDYTVTITNSGNSCARSYGPFSVDEPDEIEITPVPLSLNCFNDQTGVIQAAVNNGVAPLNFAWSNNTSGVDVDSIGGLAAGTYTVTVTDANGCVKEEGPIVVEEPDNLVALLDASDVSCNGDGDGSVVLTPEGGTPGYTFAWDDANNSTTQNLAGLLAGTYEVEVEDANGCITTESVTIDEPDSLVVEANEDQTVVLGYSTDLEVIFDAGGTGGIDYTWEPDDNSLDVTTGSMVTASPSQTTQYIVTATDQNACKDTAAVTVFVDLDAYGIPEGFTPNGDGLNDAFEIVTGAGVTVLNLRIYNRWGNIVHESNDGRWNGQYDGELQPMDTYIFEAVIELPDGTQNEEMGNFILIW